MQTDYLCIDARQVGNLSPAGASYAGGIERSITDGTLTIHIRGVLSRGGDFWGGTSTDRLVDVLRDAAGDSRVVRVVLSVNSPGGAFEGARDAAAAVRELSAKKPTIAIISDQCAGSAYWIASQCSSIFAKPDALVGSLGTIAVIADSSRQADRAGVTVHMVRAATTGEFKGAGTPGTSVTTEHLAEIKRILNSRDEFFLRDVANGRGLDRDQLDLVANGKLFTASEAVELGLVDAIRSTVGSGDVPRVIRRGPRVDSRSPMQRWDAAKAAVAAAHPHWAPWQVAQHCSEAYRDVYMAAMYDATPDYAPASVVIPQPQAVKQTEPSLSADEVVAKLKSAIDVLAATGMARATAYAKIRREQPLLVEAVRNNEGYTPTAVASHR